MADLGQRLQALIDQTEPKLRAISETAAMERSGGGSGWSRKQELGHLVDSAANNRIRFINAALAGEFTGPSYDGDGWVELGGYADMRWADVIGLWTALNRALVVAVAHIPPEKLPSQCRIGGSQPVTLEFVIADYMDHMQHHLQHIVAG